jgi:hypothetical protein
MKQMAALMDATDALAGERSRERSCVLGKAIPASVPRPVLERVDAAHPARESLERFIAGCFLRGYGAVITHFADTLLGLRGSDGLWAAALGYTLPDARSAFVEQYLDVPLDVALTTLLGESVTRSAVAEMGNMAATSAGLGRLLIVLATEHLHELGLDYVVFTATRALSNSFVRLGMPLVAVTPADPARLVDGEAGWGSYYRHGPTVMVGRVAHGLHTLCEAGNEPGAAA